jgi:NADH dehydrogenase (ubiquinone) 1 beta subcomplex subunit 10
MALPEVSPMPSPDPSIKLTDRVGTILDRDRYIKEQLVRTQEIKIIRDKLIWCYRREGVNHLQNCKELSEFYFQVIGETKGGWIKGYFHPNP